MIARPSPVDGQRLACQRVGVVRAPLAPSHPREAVEGSRNVAMRRAEKATAQRQRLVEVTPGSLDIAPIELNLAERVQRFGEVRVTVGMERSLECERRFQKVLCAIIDAESVVHAANLEHQTRSSRGLPGQC